MSVMRSAAKNSLLANALLNMMKPVTAFGLSGSGGNLSKKPEPLINRNPAVRARYELYAFTERIGLMLASGDIPPREPLDGEFIWVGPDSVEIMTEPNGEKSFFFEAVVKGFSQ